MTFSGSRFYKPLLVVLAVLLLLAAGRAQRGLNRLRGELGLTRVAPLQNAPPVLAFTTVVLGGFRGLIANVLWVRAIELQDEDKFFEMVQLADWITKLQPHMVTVWIVQAWNMSYNISIKFSDPQDRWMWVQRGIELLRDEALRYNPHQALLYRELAWHFQHKMGHYLDDAHLFFKAAWAQEMQAVLGSGRPNFDELLQPSTEDAKARVRLLRERYKLDPAKMKAVDDRYGPLEWRLPETHAIYWASVGREEAKNPDELITLRRVIYQSMQLAFHRGRIIENPFDQTIDLGPNLDIIPKAHAAYEEMMAEDAQMREHIGRGHKNFLLDAVYFLYTHNRMRAAAEWLEVVKQKYPKDYPPELTLDEYALKRVGEDVGETDMNKTISNVRAFLSRSYYNLALGDTDQATGYAALARNVWSRYMSKIVGGPSEKRVPLPPLEEMRKTVVSRLLDPETGLSPEMAGALRAQIPELSAQVDAERARAPAPPSPTAAPAPR
ncbi:MAG: hypothetical protein FJ387_08020 [Verrucomicrobia bacterium]|nr:hypothetical protein [Verrucomicrobiota bacterium]